jgi:uncharacterized repeat protein (TIGR03837 family)
MNPMSSQNTPAAKQWAIFCQVIDNFGDIGVCWRLAVNLAMRGQQVRLFVDDPSALSWMAPESHERVEVLHWPCQQQLDPAWLESARMDDVLVEAFGCAVPPKFLQAYAERCQQAGRPSHWINLEYLSAEPYVQRCHGLLSPVHHGPGAGLSKHFFYPGFEAGTGGLLREPGLLGLRQNFERQSWLSQHGIAWQGERLVSLFCYEPTGLPGLLKQLSRDEHPTLLLVAAGRSSDALRQPQLAVFGAAATPGNLRIHSLPQLTQIDYDRLLWSCDLNFVRGEDSLVRALWAQQAFIWHIYPQEDGAHHAKLQAFLNWLQASPSLRAAHDSWNQAADTELNALSSFPTLDLGSWQQSTKSAVARLLDQTELTQSLLEFVAR